MRYQRLDQIRADAAVAEARPAMSRRERLSRWADILDRDGDQPLDALHGMEFYSGPERRRLRLDRSPIAVAYADPVLRAEGLSGDTLGDAQLFFGLSDDAVHWLLCDCHVEGVTTGRTAARRVRILAQPGLLGLLARTFL